MTDRPINPGGKPEWMTIEEAAAAIGKAIRDSGQTMKRLGVIVPQTDVNRRARKIAPWWRFIWPRTIDRQRATLELIEEIDDG